MTLSANRDIPRVISKKAAIQGGLFNYGILATAARRFCDKNSGDNLQILVGKQ
jgi:hypothetical protein